MSENLQYFRAIYNFLPSEKERKIVLITGARQTGKTTLAKNKYNTLRYINLDSPEIRDGISQITASNWHKDIGKAILDEAQKEPSLFEKVKYAYDGGNLNFQVILGSSQILLLKKIRESLAGRISLYELWPLMMSEIYAGPGAKIIKPPLIDRIFEEEDFQKLMESLPSVLIGEEDIKLKEAQEHLLRWGGMPFLLSINNAYERQKWLRDYTYTYLERDLADLSRIEDLEPFKKFQTISALRNAKLLNYSELARDVGISVDTSKRYLEYLKISYQTILLQPYGTNITSSAVKTPKIYWLDIGLLRQMTGFWGDVISGDIFETLVISEIYKWIKTMQKPVSMYFYRTRSGLELDILLKINERIIGIEIKNRSTVTPSDLRPMKAVADGLGKLWSGGILVYNGDRIGKIAEPDIWMIPSRRLF
jgi:predicted AAA+ superfamily ATPase